MSIWDAWSSTLPGYADLANDAEFKLITPGFKKKIHDILFNYGIGGTAEQTSLAEGMPIAENPYSVAALLRRQNTEDMHGTYNAANAAGLEESGAAAAGINANNQNLTRGLTQATTQMGQDISGELTGYTGQVGSIFNRVQGEAAARAAAKAAADAAAAQAAAQASIAAAAPPPGAAVGTGTAWPVPQQEYVRTGPEAGGPMTTGSQNVVNALKKKVIVGPQNVGLPGYR